MPSHSHPTNTHERDKASENNINNPFLICISVRHRLIVVIIDITEYGATLVKNSIDKSVVASAADGGLQVLLATTRDIACDIFMHRQSARLKSGLLAASGSVTTPHRHSMEVGRSCCLSKKELHVLP